MAGNENLRHVIEADCEDPDCEIHHPEVGLEEGTIDETHLAYYLAGAFAMELGIRQSFYRSEPHGSDAREAFIQACLHAGRPIFALANGRW
jgi:hypothetical protein